MGGAVWMLISPQTKTAGSFDPAIQSYSTPEGNSPQPAFFSASGAAAAFFFSIARFKSSARGDSTSAFALIKNASSPPRWSRSLMALVETRRRTFLPSTSEMKVTLHRFGRKRRLVLMLEWLTVWPTCGPLAVSSQRRDISKILCRPRTFPPSGVQNHVHLGSRGRIGRVAGGVKVLGVQGGCEKAGFAGPRGRPAII